MLPALFPKRSLSLNARVLRRRTKEFTLNMKKLFAFVLISIFALMQAITVFAVGSDEGESSPVMLNDDMYYVDAYTVAPQSGSSTGIATIEANPSRLASPGTVEVTIKLRNTGNQYGGNSSDVKDDAFGGSSLNDQSALDPSITINPSTEPVKPSPSPTPTTTPPSEPTPTPDITITPTSGPDPTPVPTPGLFTNVNITNAYNAVFTTSDVSPGQVGVYRTSMMVTEAMIGQTLSFTISWFDTSVNRTYYQQLALVIQRSDTAYLRLTRTSSTANAAIGDEVKFVYTVVNTGTRRLNTIKIVDDKIGGSSPIAAPFSLASGEKREIVYTYKMKSASVVSKPTATFVPDGSSTVLSVTVSKLTIGLVTAQLTKSATIGTPTPEGVPFTLFLTNNGSQNLTNLTVKDDLGTVLASSFTLAIGESKIIEHFVPNPSTVRNVVFYITGKYDADKEFSDNTASYTVRPYINPDLLGIRFSGEVRRTLDGDNSIGLTFTVKNTGQVTYTNVILTEKELGYNIHEIPTLAPNSGDISFNVDLKIDEPRELVFYLTALDSSGNTHLFEAYINASSIDIDSSVPNATPVPGDDSGASIVDIDVDRQISDKGQKLLKLWNTLKIIFIFALVVVLLLGAFEIYLFIRSRRAAKR